MAIAAAAPFSLPGEAPELVRLPGLLRTLATLDAYEEIERDRIRWEQAFHHVRDMKARDFLRAAGLPTEGLGWEPPARNWIDPTRD